MYARYDFNPSESYGQSCSGRYNNMQNTMKKLVIPNRSNVQLNQYNPSTGFYQEQRSNFAGNADRENGQMLNRSFANGSSTSTAPGFQKSSYERQYNPSTSYNQEQRSNFTGNVNKENRNFVNGSNTSNAPGFQKTSYDRRYNSSTSYNQEQRSNFTGNVDKEKRSFVNGSSTSTTPGVQKTSYERREGTSTNQLGLMGMPKPKPNSFSAQSSTASSRKMDNVSQIDNRPKSKMLGESAGEKLFILTGTVERVIKYGKIFQNHFCYFQVLGSVVSIATGKVDFEKTMLLRDKKGPILQLNYYSNSTHINIEDFHLGQNLRAVGRMVGPNVMSAITIRGASDDEMEILPRLCYISDYAVSTLCGDGQI